MKKIFFIILFFSIFLLTGCGKYNARDIVKDINKKMNKIASYHMEGDMEIYNGDDVYKYDVKSSYENENYRVSLTNKSNNHEQIILKNSDGVYVLTPSLNKSFKFQSNWPNNSSQVYILKSIQNDINNDKNMKFEETNDGYILNAKLHKTNNRNFAYEKIYLNKNLDINKIEVFDDIGNKQVKIVYNNLDTKASFNNKYFSTKENMKLTDNTNMQDKSKTTSLLEDSIYPMYLPSGTYFSDEQSVSKDDGDRIILTFAGESPFILVEESVIATSDMEVIPVYGDPTILVDTIGALSEKSVNFISNGIEYYIASDSMTMQEIIQVAESINSLPVLK